MERHDSITFDFTEDKENVLLVTSHEGNDGSISIHCSGSTGQDGYCTDLTKGQAKDLISKLQEAIIKLEVYERTHKKEDNHGTT